MKPEVAASNPGRELEGGKGEKEAAGKNVQQRQDRVGGKPAVEGAQLRCPLLREWIVSMKRMQDLPSQGLGPGDEVRREDASADRRSHSYRCEQSHAQP